MDSAYESMEGEATASITIERSVFNALAIHVTQEDQVNERLSQIRVDNPKARHTVWAYVLHNGSVRASDDGEPQGTAGKPTLAVLQHSGLSDIALFTTRYFGGVLLGAGGLVRAYTQAAQACLEKVQRVSYVTCTPATFSVSYALYEQAVRIVKAYDATIDSSDFTDIVTLTALFKGHVPEDFSFKLSELTNGSAEITIGQPSIYKI